MKYLMLIIVGSLLTSTDSFSNEFSEKVDTLFSTNIQKDAPGCSVGVIKDGTFIHKAGYGLANMELDVALSGDNVHRIASVSKQFTAMAVLLLAEEGKIDLEEDIRTYLPSLKNYGEKITINSMLGHFSGMADYDFISGGERGDVENGLNIHSVAGGPFRLGNEDYLTIEEFYDLVKQVPLRHAPNEKWDYSNLAYFLLSMLVEEVSGESLRQYADKRIFKPLGMTNTFFSDNPTEIVKNRASGYKPTEEGGYITDMTNLFWVGDGGLHTTVSDMLKWDQNFYNPKVGKKPAKLLELLNKPNSNFDKRGMLYANGQMIVESNGRKSFSHGGGWLGVRTFYERFPADRFSTIILCNDSSQNPREYAKQIAKAYFK
ncbi:serine hydrolase domain-containing protein [Thalassotalea sp. 1_MG-2023]|nr:serine hydrolase domain-containing protein [Thalassotalea sp. 1_MG-2023]